MKERIHKNQKLNNWKQKLEQLIADFMKKVTKRSIPLRKKKKIKISKLKMWNKNNDITNIEESKTIRRHYFAHIKANKLTFGWNYFPGNRNSPPDPRLAAKM